jgi:hypothetical protein
MKCLLLVLSLVMLTRYPASAAPAPSSSILTARQPVTAIWDHNALRIYDADHALLFTQAFSPVAPTAPLPGTEVKISRFEMKEAYNGATGEKVDVSELTLTSTKTNQSVVLLFNKVTDISALLK